MQVLQLTQRFPPAIGGVEEHVLHLSRKLRERGVDVRVATTDLRRDVPFERLSAPNDSYPFPVVRHRAYRLSDAPNGLGILAPAMLLDVLNGSADVVHAHAYGHFPTWAGSAAYTLGRSAVVITPHSDQGHPTLSKRIFDRVAPRFTLRQSSRVIAVTRREADHLVDLGLDAGRIAVIPNGIEPGEFLSIPRPHPPRDSVTGLFVGRLASRQKGLEPLVEALARVPRNLNLHLRIVGEDWGGASLVDRLAVRLGVRDRITMTGALPRKALLAEYAQADFLALPSLFEPFGIVLLEAMAAGLPVVASRVGGIPEIVADEQTGLLVEPGDVRGLAAALARMAGEPELRGRYGERGRARIGPYSWEALVPRILAVYREAIEERGR